MYDRVKQGIPDPEDATPGFDVLFRRIIGERKGIGMKLKLIIILCTVWMAATQANAAEKIQLKTKKDKLSYQKGVYWGNEFKRRSIEVDQKIFLRGIEDSLSGAATLLTTKEMVEIEEDFQRAQAARKREEKK